MSLKRRLQSFISQTLFMVLTVAFLFNASVFANKSQVDVQIDFNGFDGSQIRVEIRNGYEAAILIKRPNLIYNWATVYRGPLSHIVVPEEAKIIEKVKSTVNIIKNNFHQPGSANYLEFSTWNSVIRIPLQYQGSRVEFERLKSVPIKEKSHWKFVFDPEAQIYYTVLTVMHNGQPDYTLIKRVNSNKQWSYDNRGEEIGEPLIKNGILRFSNHPLAYNMNAHFDYPSKSNSYPTSPPKSLSNTAEAPPQAPSSLSQESPPTGSPKNIQSGLAKLLKNETTKSDLEKKISAKVFGQDHLVKALVKASEVLDDPSATKPKVVVITGISGVGKSFVAQQLAENRLGSDFILTIDGTKYASLRDDMIDVMIHKLLGAEGAWKGDQKGELVEFFKRTKGKGVVIINEGDKMHRQVYIRLMEFFETGKLPAGQGDEIIARNSMVVITSNRGVRELLPEDAKNWSESQQQSYVSQLSSDRVKSVYTQKQNLKDNFVLPEEVVNRVDQFLFAAPLTKSVLNSILKASVLKQNKQLEQKYEGLNFNISDKALEYLATVNVNLFTHGREMNRRAEDVFSRLTDSITQALTSGRWRVDQFESLDVDLNQDPKTRTMFLEVNKDLKVDTLQPVNPNPLADPKNQETLRNLKKNLEQRVIGQSDMINEVHKMALNHLAEGERSRPTVFMVVGTTGTGKTETGLALAESLYGSEKKAKITDLGDISSNHKFELLFHMGPDGTECEFERYLRNNPNGGVFIGDEASNMGGEYREIKTALFKKLYGILDRKTWTSPVTNQEYDLSKHIFLFTGNDGEHLLQGSSADEDRLVRWRAAKNPQALSEMMIEGGVPEAFLGRLASMIFAKPLLKSEVKPIAEKMLKEKINPLEKQYTGLKIRYSESTLNSLAESFYTHSSGVRSIRSLIDKNLGSAVQSSLLKAASQGVNLRNMEGVEIDLSIEDNKVKTPYKEKNSPPRQAELVLTLKQNQVPNVANISERVDLTPWTEEQVLLRKQEAWLTSLHEAAHGIANDPDITSEKVAYITIRGGTSGSGKNRIRYLGYARTQNLDDGHTSLTPARVLAQLSRLAAGGVAERLAGHPTTSGWSNDLEQMTKLAQASLLRAGFDQRFYGIQFDKEGHPILSNEKRRLLERATNDLIQKSIEIAEDRLRRRWSDVVRVAEELLRQGEINGVRFDELVKNPTPTKSLFESPAWLNLDRLMCRGIFKGL